MPLCKKSMERSIIFLARPLAGCFQVTTQFPEFVNLPIILASTPRLCKSLFKVFHLFFGTDNVMRSCDSEIQISHGRSPGYLSGTFSKLTSAPPDSLAISATEQDSPPAPLSV